MTDITEFKLFGYKLYLSPILDLFNGEIITYTIGPRPTYSLVSNILEKSFERLKEKDELSPLRSGLALPDETVSPCLKRIWNNTEYVT
uniref:Integrase catalytic domain-containing protein n=1 Tax=Anaerobacillus isosaccharinicus TaxID=1532552 RepID=A0A7S7L9G1_9BACI|nr:hypothetical protein [Anaerobacillus isosaccharinicus]QOY36807.1 hypothetical protein AWH56_003900 [Anaerobacillus isosaccharinicus]